MIGVNVKLSSIVACLLFAVVLTCAGCIKKDSGQAARRGNGVAGTATLLATIAAGEKPPSIPVPSGPGGHAPLEASFQPVFSTQGRGVAYSAESNGQVYVVHNGIARKPYATTGSIAISSDGTRLAYGALSDGTWRMVIDGVEGEPFSTVKAPIFSPDGVHVAYQAMSGDKWHLVVDATRNAGTDTRILDSAFSGDSAKVAYIDNASEKNQGRLVVSDLKFTKQTVVADKVTRFVVNGEGTKLACVSAGPDGKFSIVEAAFDRPDAVTRRGAYDRVLHISFGPENGPLVYIAEQSGKRLVVYDGRQEPLPDGGEILEPPVLRSDLKGCGVLISANGMAYLHETPAGVGRKQKQYEEVAHLAVSRDGKSFAYAASRGGSWFVVVNEAEGPMFDRVVTPKFSPDGKYLVYRARQAGRRFVVVADKTGKTIKTHPAYEQVFDVQFTADGKSVAYGVKDGNRLIWQVEKL